MNRFLYKYMSMRKDFFENLMIRATQPFVLNDPFEARFNKKQYSDAVTNQTNYYIANGEDVFDNTGIDIDGVIGSIQSDFNSLGIISLSEDFDNPLMWSHYADQHKGMVIEFDTTKPLFMDSLLFNDGRESRFGKDPLALCYEFPEKVSYSRVIPSFERKELSAPDTMDDYHWRKFNKTILFTKSNDWMYEKEQRIIVPLIEADSVIFQLDSNLQEFVDEQLKKDKTIELVNLEKGKIKITYPREYEMHEEMGDQSIKKEIFYLSKYDMEEAIYLFRLNPEAISGIYFGLKSNHFEALEYIKNNKNLKNLSNINKMILNPNLYQLEFKKIKI